MPDDIKLPPAGTGDSSTALFDASSLKAEAKAYAPAAPAAVAAPPPPPSGIAPTFADALKADAKPASTEQAAAPNADGATATTPAQSEALEINDTQLYKVTTKVNGVEKTEYLPGSEVRTRQMLRSHYTQEMQALRAKEDQVNEKLGQLTTLEEQAQRAAHYENLLTTEDALQKYVDQAFPGRFSRAEVKAAAAQLTNEQAGKVPGAADPLDLVSHGDANVMLGETTKRLEAEFGRKLTEVEKKLVERAEGILGSVDQVVDRRLGQIAKAQRVAGIDTKITAKINELFTAHPHVAADDPDYADYVRYQIGKLKPKTEQEMFDTIEHFVVGRSQAIIQKLTDAKIIAAKERLVANGVEAPANAHTQLPVKDTFQKTDGSWDWDGLKRDSSAYVNAQR